MLGTVVEIDVHDDDAGQRADRFLRKLLARAPLDLIHRLLRKRAVRIDGRTVEGSTRLRSGDRLTIELEAARFAELCGGAARSAARAPARADRPPLAVVHEDRDLLVIDKPGGLAVHGGTGVGDDHLTARLAELIPPSGARAFRPAPAHRIDRGTSGLVAIGRSGAGLRGLTAAFREQRVDKRYLAVVHGRPSPPTGRIELALEVADRGAQGRKARPDERGRRARSSYRTLRTARGLSLVEVELETGRTHQIRAHLAALGHPIVGDRRYGAPATPSLGPHRIALHAARLSFPHPITGTIVAVEAPLPRELRELV